MGIDSQFQTIVYYRDTGDIQSILPNSYIKSRKALNSRLNLPESTGLKFFYVPGGFPLRSADWKVELSIGNKAPRLVAIDGRDGHLIMAQCEAEHIWKSYRSVIFEFEGGFGDYMDELDVVIACRKKYPKTKIGVDIYDSRKEVFSMFEGFKDVKIISSPGQARKRCPRIKFSKIDSLGGKYLPGGKVGIYSMIGGLSSTAGRAKIEVPQNDIQNARALIQERIGLEWGKIFALHTISGKCNTKSIPAKAVTRLLKPLIKNNNIYFLHLGGAGEEEIKHRQIIPFQGKLSWKEVFAVMSLCDGCICIDSAILHIAQHMGLPTVSFWGPTNPENILGTNSGITCVTTSSSCRGCNRYECSNNKCMLNFSLKEVEKSLLLLNNKGNFNGGHDELYI